jgi:hypothetical protein
VNTGNLATLRPTSVDLVTVDPTDELMTAVWRHTRRVKFAEGVVRADEQIRRQEAAQTRCQICGALLTSSAPVYRPWSNGAAFCSQCSEAVNLAGAERHLDENRGAIRSWLAESTG